jgi:hypothetical protein
MGRKNKYNSFPARQQVPVGGLCLLCQCSRQIRKAARPFVQGKKLNNSLGFSAVFPILEPGMKFTGVNNITGEEETFEVRSVLIMQPHLSTVERIK